MSDIADQLNRLAKGIAFPARLRVFAAQEWAGLVPAGYACEWPCARPADLLAAACGAAWAEARRGGRVAVVVGTHAACGAAWTAARALVDRLRLDNLHVLMAECPPAKRGRDDGLRHEWQPVRLASLPMGGLPPWPVDGDGQAMETWLTKREPRLFLAHVQPGWAQAEPGPAWCAALGQLAAEGLRVVWRVPVAVRLAELGETLADLGRRGLGLKLIVSEPVPAEVLTKLDGWWVWSPADAGELAAVLANVLDHEEPSLVVLPSADVVITPWPAERAVVAGDGREVLAGGKLTVIADGRLAGRALALARALGDAGAFACTCVHPLPVAQLAALALRGPMVVLGVELAAAINVALVPTGGARMLPVMAVPETAKDLVTLTEAVNSLR